jgi:NTP pyrophosphatase (non-canonical NTP hydrolase)
MNFKDYQNKASTTAIYHKPYGSTEYCENKELLDAGKIIPIMYCALGLAGESGEVAEQVKKSWRNSMKVTDDRREKIKDELGDVLWYASQLATELNLDLEEIAEKNLNKLLARKSAGELKHE